MTEAQPKKSDLGVRTLSAVVMLVVAGVALWLGGLWWAAFVAAISLGVFWEWLRLARKFESKPFRMALWWIAGLIYIGGAAFALIYIGPHSEFDRWGQFWAISLLVFVSGIDVGAYFAGRTVGGPRIAPAISPSKTWSGLAGGMLGGFLLLLGWWTLSPEMVFRGRYGFGDGGLFLDWRDAIWPSLFSGIVGAIVAQSGDFFESWMKRRAGVKDSSNLIPGHGGLFDRVDGLLAVAFVSLIYLVVTSPL